MWGVDTGITSYCENTGHVKVTELKPGFMAGWRDRKKQEDKNGDNFYTREDYWLEQWQAEVTNY